MRDKQLLIIIPCFNEEDSVRALVKEIDRAMGLIGQQHTVVVIDDGSTDRTAERARAVSQVLPLPFNLGIGGAVQTGIKYALRNHFDFCMQIDGDGQHPPSEIETLLNAYEGHPSNVVIGSRFLGAGTFRSTILRRCGIWGIRSWHRLLSGHKVSDPTSGFRLMDKKAIAVFSREYPVDYPEPISLSLSQCYGLTVSEVPIAMKARLNGKSSIGGLRSISYMIRVCLSLLLVHLKGPTHDR